MQCYRPNCLKDNLLNIDNDFLLEFINKSYLTASKNKPLRISDSQNYSPVALNARRKKLWVSVGLCEMPFRQSKGYYNQQFKL